MLTRYEEVVKKELVEKDTHDRFPAKESMAYKLSKDGEWGVNPTSTIREEDIEL